jgi:hypothetical protein
MIFRCEARESNNKQVNTTSQNTLWPSIIKTV